MKHGAVLILGLVIGLLGGLIYTWVIQPVEYYNTYPPLMGETYRRTWIAMTAQAYGAEGNWERTRVRLTDLPEDEVRQVVTDELERAVAAGASFLYLQRISELAQAYGASSPAIQIYGEGEALDTPTARPTVPTATPTVTLTPTPTSTPTPTFTPTPTARPTSVFSPSIRVVSQTLTCTIQPRIAVSIEISATLDEESDDEPVWTGDAMREIWLLWDGGADRAITGFRPEQGQGYADFTVVPGRVYNLYVDSPTGVPVRTLQAEPCAPDEGEGWTSRWLLIREFPPKPTPTPRATATATSEPTDE
jgi:hypothetical protein